MSEANSTTSDLEKQVLGLIAEVLRLPGVTVEDNLLALGVDSLLGTRLVVRLQSQFDVDLTLLDLFENPDVADFVDLVAEVVEERLGE